MAIVDMKRIRLLGMVSDQDRLLKIMQRFGCVQISPVDASLSAYAGNVMDTMGSAQSDLTRIAWTIQYLNRYDTTKSSLLTSLSMPTASDAQAQQVADNTDQLMGIVKATESIERQSGDLRGQEARLRAHMDQLLPWRQLTIPVEKIRDSRDTVQFVGTVNNQALPSMEAALDGLPVTVERIYDERESVFLWILAHRDAQTEVQDALKAADFSATSFAGEQGSVASILDRLRAELTAAQAARDALEAECRTLAQDMPKLKLLYEVVSARAEREGAQERLATTSATFLMEGWVPAVAADRLAKKLHGAAPDIELECRDPLPEEKPPTLLRNNRIAAPFETIVTSYSYPDPRGIDPTVVMAPFFACLFGMMLSDAGYGLVMSIAIPLIIRFLKPKPGTRKMLWVLFFGGLCTVFWGAMFDTWFGASIKPMLINTLEQPLEMMALCLGMGALHLFTGLGVAAYMNIKRGKILDAVFDQLLWLILIIGLPMMLLPATAAIGKWMAIGGAVGIFLTAGRDKPNIVGRLLGGGGALYGISSWLSDLLSYMRLFGMGLATGVIGMVINMLVGLIMGNGIIGIVIGVAVLIGGHIFNFAINALGAYVHSCRLQYIEFFSKFYEDGGDPFTPLAQKPLYVAIQGMDPDGVE